RYDRTDARAMAQSVADSQPQTVGTTSQSPAPMPRWRVWFMATRPWSLTISVIPILLPSALAWVYGDVSITFGILMLLTSVLTHIACNLTNDYFDDAS